MKSSRRIPELDGIRGVAIALVLYWHYFAGPAQTEPGTLLSYLKAAGRLSWSGVDLFFVLSGFLIGGILLDSRDRSDYFRSFYIRRFFRIVPIYSVVLAGSAIFLLSSGVTSNPYAAVGPWYTYPLFLQNFWMAGRVDTYALGFLGVTWSLAVEEQFYLTLPAIIRKVRRHLPHLIAAGIFAAPILRIVLFYGFPRHFVAPRALMPCRVDALLLGVVGAMLWRNESCRMALANHKLILRTTSGIALFAVGIITLHDSWSNDVQMASFGFTCLAILYLSVLLLAVSQPETWIGSCLRFTPLRWLGRVAYGVYLLHATLFLALRFTHPLWPLWQAVFPAAVLTSLIATVSWHYFEKPLVELSHQLTS